MNIDLLNLDSRLNAKQLHLRQQVSVYVKQTILPTINTYWERAEFPRQMAMGLQSLPIMGGTIQGYGCASLDPLSAGLVRYELARGDGSIGTFYGVHSGLAMGSIGLLGSEEQKERWLPAMARLEMIGAFGLSEPERGSDAANVKTTARRDGDHYLLNGRKRWIGNAAIANLLIIWARDEHGQFGGFVVEEPHKASGVTIKDINGKISKRSVLNADITLQDVAVPIANRLTGANHFSDVARVLTLTRYSVAWEAAGVAAACLEYALAYAVQREQFGRPIARFQLIQRKLVEMASEVLQMQLLCFHLAEMMAQEKVTTPLISLAKYNNARKARRVTMLAREILGGNGILLENHVARLLLDAEAIYTYEGTNEINLLIVGRELTGIGAFY